MIGLHTVMLESSSLEVSSSMLTFSEKGQVNLIGSFKWQKASQLEVDQLL